MTFDSPTQQRRHLYDLAIHFHKLAPWKYVLDAHVFAVVHPQTCVKAYSSVLGNLEEMMGIVMYLGPAGLKCLKDLVLDEDDNIDYEEMGYRQEGIICFFPEKEDLMDDELEELEDVGLQFKDGSQVPVFKRYSAGWMPGAVSDSDAVFLQYGLEQALIVCADAAQDPEIASQLGIKDDGTILARMMGSDGKWVYERIKADSTVDFSPAQIIMSDAELAELNKLERMDKIWLFEHLYFNMPSYSEETDRGFFPKAIVLLEVENATMVGIEAITPTEFLDSVGQVIFDTCITNQYVPQQVVVANRENYILLKNLCKTLGVDLYLDTEMNMVAELREAVMEMFNGEQDDEN